MPSPEIETTGHAVVDTLQGLQLVVSNVIDPEQKRLRIERAAEIMGISQIYDTELLVATRVMYAHSPGQTDSMHLFTNDMLFAGRVESVSHMFDENVPLDSIMINFDEPDMFNVDPEDKPFFQVMRLHVPVMAIRSCMAA